ncbi:MAG: MoaD/ThiS family protein [Saprospiraceae bacterium]|nr:MoaD/ThiS family protein [Saprospiraceae bacterium]
MIIKCFGIAKDITRSKDIVIKDRHPESVAELRSFLRDSYPSFNKIPEYMVAVNMEYAPDDQLISENDVIAIIPPVSGG